MAASAKESLSGRAAVTVMQTAEVGRGDHATVLWRLNLPRHRRVVVKRPVCPSVVVVFDVFIEDAAQVVLAEEDHVVQALAADRAAHPLNLGVLPG
jgi:hypothetical protein